MALEAKAQAVWALHRFGLGPRPGAIAAVGSDARGAFMAELEQPRLALIRDPDLLTSAQAARGRFDYCAESKTAEVADRAFQRYQRRMARRAAEFAAKGDGAKAADRPQTVAPSKPGRPGPVTNPNAPAGTVCAMDDPPQRIALAQRVYLEEATARLDAALDAEIGLLERLTWFWSNHFCVSAGKGVVKLVTGAFEREAIRPHVLGRFADMLLAVETHPAMLYYLDNARSIGPNSRAGQRRNKGLNENLAREILELHTLGVRSVYTQEDVTNFAKIITGWSVRRFRDPERGGEFEFNPHMHEPGPQRVIGKTYPDNGFDQGKAVLADLARHPATAQHMATKLARHFVADEPPPSLVDRLTRRFLETDGNLNEITKTLLGAPEAWDQSHRKLKRPGEWIIAAMRATGDDVLDAREVQDILKAQQMLGERLWMPPAPKGFADDDAAWLAGLPQRLDIAQQLARRTGADPQDVVDIALGPLASEQTLQTLRGAESRVQGLTLVLMAPEFQRR